MTMASQSDVGHSANVIPLGSLPVEASAASPAASARELKGWMVFAFMIAFFGVVIGVNAFMAYAALSTFGGVDADSAYRAGQVFEYDVAMAKMQDAQRWQVEAKITRANDGTMLLDIAARDMTGAPLVGLTATAVLARPTDRRLDRAVSVRENAPGRYNGSIAIPAGQWDLVIELARQGERQFRSKNRVIIR